ncbi:MAG: two-component system response regulator NarL [Gammaproteobacteria bacterium]
MRVLIIDDHALFRVGLQELLERRGIEVCGAVGDGKEGLRMASETQPDIVLLDLRMPNTDGITVLRALRDAGLQMPVVMLTTSSDERDLVESLRSGAQGYLVKDMEPDEVVSALTEVIEGQTVVAPGLTGVLADAVRSDHSENAIDASPFAELTPRETEILCHLAEGQSNKVIARNLGISDGTVKLHVKAILRKLGVHSRVEAAVMAVQHGLSRKQLESSNL